MEDLKLALVQTALHWENIPANLEMLTQKLSSIGGKADVIILPEMFSTGFSMKAQKLAETMDGSAVTWMREKAEQLNSCITGSLIIEEAGKYHNRLIWAQPDGIVFHYDKRHLFSMAEEEKTYTAGHQKLIIEYKGWKICPMICYDLRFPVWIRNTEQYDLLIFVANWPERRIKHWQKLLPARAIENQAYCVGVNRVGNDGNGIYYNGSTGAIDPMGDEIALPTLKELATLLPSGEDAIAFVDLPYDEITKARRYMPFLKDRDGFVLEG